MQRDTTTILLLSSTPSGTFALRTGAEIRDIMDEIHRAKQRDRFRVVHRSAARVRDLRRALLDHRPNVVHFCGHADDARGLLFEDDGGARQWVRSEHFRELLGLFSENLECIILNACYTEGQGMSLAMVTRSYVIGMPGEIEDRLASNFAVSFYEAMGAGAGIPFAYALSCNSMKIAGAGAVAIPTLSSP